MQASARRHGRETAASGWFDLDVVGVGGASEALLDDVKRNVATTAALLGRLASVNFRCGCALTLAAPPAPGSPWQVMAWHDARCANAAHGAVKARWETSNLG
jgi:hypothetical protein